MVLLQKWLSFQLFFLANIGQENIFYGILERKNAFLDYKNQKFKKTKNSHFSKIPMVLVQKWQFFQLFFFRKYMQRKCLLRYSRTKKTPFYAIKNSKSRKPHFFPKRLTHCLVQKWPFVQRFFFRQLRLGKCLLRYYRMENRLSTL